MPDELSVAFWNVQNLFQPQVVSRGPGDQDELDTKLDVIAGEIDGFFGGDGADLIGLAEVNDRNVFDELAGRLGDVYLKLWEPAYRTDQTGLGVLARKSVFEDFTLLDVFRPTTAARPRSLVAACKVGGASAGFLFVVNHWKSRMGSAEIGNLDRLETANWISDRLKNSPIECTMLIGDFNAEPYEEPFNGKLKGRRNFRGAFVSHDAYFLYNTAWKFLSEPVHWKDFDVAGYEEERPTASHDASTVNLFDHLLVSKHALKNGTLTLREETVELLCNDVTARPNSHGQWRPKRWKYQSPAEHVGSSDHFPLLAKFHIS
jgi:endonuclease/exonuclease/phosphatase family metal-dependent hydrolase